MGNYKIKVNVEIVECNESESIEPMKKKDGNFEMTISEGTAISIDNVEKALLRTNYDAIRDAISRHLTDISKKNFKTKKRRRIATQRTSVSSRW